MKKLYCDREKRDKAIAKKLYFTQTPERVRSSLRNFYIRLMSKRFIKAYNKGKNHFRLMPVPLSLFKDVEYPGLSPMRWCITHLNDHFKNFTFSSRHLSFTVDFIEK